MKRGKFMVSLNPEFGIELEAILKVAERVRDTRPELHAVLSTVAAAALAGDEKTLLKYCNSYLSDKVSGDKFLGELKLMFDKYIDLESPSDIPPYPPVDDDEL